ncbi:MAG: MBL fold metallo-hydrolase [Opitutaceae bacterium]|nr:MBL fold metallo-hydrolase [Opitutaceae bacterium]
MAMRFCILGSGSSGNSALLQTAGANVLVDAGFSARKLGQLLATVGHDLARIDAIFITHEHGDHASAIEGLKKFPHIRLFANPATARAVQAKLSYRADWVYFETGSTFQFRDLEIAAFAVPHDAQDPVGFRISHGFEGDLLSPRRSLAWLTDLGYAPQHIHEHLRGADVVVVEANHCADLLKNDTKRPWSLKQRISGRHGHLSNQSARELLESIASPRWRHIFLTHLSRDCNSPEAVSAAFAGSRLGCELSIVAPGLSTPLIEFV